MAMRINGDQTVHIVVHNHEGEIEAHLNHDGIEYDFNQDPSNKINTPAIMDLLITKNHTHH